MPPSYRHTETNPTTLTIVAVLTLAGAVAWLGWMRPLGAPWWIFALALAPPWLGAYVFSRLTTEVADGALSWRFGFGIPRQRVPLAEIASVERVELPSWMGPGVRYMPGLTTWLVKTGPGLLVKLHSGKAMRIGSDDADGLAAAILSAPRR